MRKQFISLGACLLFVALWLFTPEIASAQGSIIDPTSSKYTYGNYNLNDILSLATWAAQWILGIVGSLTLVMFIYGGFVFLTSGGSSEKVGEAKKIITAAVIGLIIVFASYMIVQFVTSALGLRWSGGELEFTKSATVSTAGSTSVQTSSLPPNSVSGEGSSCSSSNSLFKCTSSTNTGYCLSTNPCTDGLNCCAPACSDSFAGYTCVDNTTNTTDCKTNYCKTGTCCLSKCVDEKGDEGFSCMAYNEDYECKTGLCPGNNSIQCCKPNP